MKITKSISLDKEVFDDIAKNEEITDFSAWVQSRYCAEFFNLFEIKRKLRNLDKMRARLLDTMSHIYDEKKAKIAQISPKLKDFLQKEVKKRLEKGANWDGLTNFINYEFSTDFKKTELLKLYEDLKKNE
jgi:transcriptional regulator of heat shock response